MKKNYLYKYFRYIFAVLPFVFTFLFSFVMVLDFLRVYSSISINNSSVKTNYANNWIMKSDGYLTVNNEKVLIINPNDSFDVTLAEDNFICSIKTGGYSDTFIFERDGEYVSLSDCIFLDSYLDDSGTAVVSILDDSIGNIDLNTKFADAYYQGDSVIIKYNNKIYTLPSNINFIKDNNTVTINNRFVVPYSEDGVFLTTELPNDGIYYDTVEGVLLRHTGEEFAKNFILSSNAILVFISSLGLFIMLYVFGVHREIKEFSNKYCLITNIIGALSLGVVSLFSYIMLS